jgi:pseudouridine-5'-phosphate glycosidase
VESPGDVARIFKAQRELSGEAALLVTVPVPSEFEAPAETLKKTLEAALNSAEQEQIGGRELTPYLLSFMSKESAGVTLKANIALLENNARVAAEIAVAISELGIY